MADFYEFDPDHSPGAFMGIFAYYNRLFWMVFAAGLALSVLIGFRGLASDFFLISTVLSFLFNGLTLFFYESYLHGKMRTRQSNYSAAKHSIVLVLGILSTCFFIAGLVAVYRGV